MTTDDLPEPAGIEPLAELVYDHTQGDTLHLPRRTVTGWAEDLARATDALRAVQAGMTLPLLVPGALSASEAAEALHRVIDSLERVTLDMVRHGGEATTGKEIPMDNSTPPTITTEDAAKIDQSESVIEVTTRVIFTVSSADVGRCDAFLDTGERVRIVAPGMLVIDDVTPERDAVAPVCPFCTIRTPGMADAVTGSASLAVCARHAAKGCRL